MCDDKALQGRWIVFFGAGVFERTLFFFWVFEIVKEMYDSPHGGEISPDFLVSCAVGALFLFPSPFPNFSPSTSHLIHFIT